MSAFRVLLVVLFVCIAGYTAVVITHHGIGLFEVFLGDMRAMGWPGQFNLDFMSLLALSGLWLAWRHHFSPLGLMWGVLGFFGGGLVLSAYLLAVTFQAEGDMKEVLLGKTRAAS